MATIIQNRRDTASNWTSVNPLLAEGEFGVETDTRKVKIGNGTDNWNSLSYAISPSYTLVDVGTAQNTYKGYAIPKIEVDDAITAYNSFISGTHTALLWTLSGNPTYLNIISSNDVSDTYSIDVCLHNQFHITYSWSSSTTTYCDYEVVDKSAKTITVTGTTPTIALESDAVYNCGSLTSLTVTYPTSVDNSFIAEVDFTSGATATILTMPSGTKFKGDDTATSGTTSSFTPTANKRYQMLVSNDGVNYRCVVSGEATA